VVGKIVNRAVEAAAAVDQVVTAHSLEVFGGPRRIIAAMEYVVKIRAANTRDTGEGVGAGRCVAYCGSGSAAIRIECRIPAIAIEYHGHARRGVQIGNPRRAVTGDLIVTAAPLELVEKAEGVGCYRAAGIGAVTSNTLGLF